MREVTGAAAGLIWHTLNKEGELSLTKLKRLSHAKAPTFDWALGWLLRGDKIIIQPEKRSLRVRLK
jgi:hypothetical protein